MKRIVLLGLVCFALSGCGDDGGGKVTNEFLVGKWECKLDSYRSKMKNGKFTDYVSDGFNIKRKEEFKIENNKLYSISKTEEDGLSFWESNDWDESDRTITHTGQTVEKKENNLIEKSTNSLIKKSHDTYLMIEEYIKTPNEQYDSEDDIEALRIKTEAFCTRIK